MFAIDTTVHTRFLVTPCHVCFELKFQTDGLNVKASTQSVDFLHWSSEVSRRRRAHMPEIFTDLSARFHIVQF